MLEFVSTVMNMREASRDHRDVFVVFVVVVVAVDGIHSSLNCSHEPELACVTFATPHFQIRVFVQRRISYSEYVRTYVLLECTEPSFRDMWKAKRCYEVERCNVLNGGSQKTTHFSILLILWLLCFLIPRSHMARSYLTLMEVGHTTHKMLSESWRNPIR